MSTLRWAPGLQQGTRWTRFLPSCHSYSDRGSTAEEIRAVFLGWHKELLGAGDPKEVRESFLEEAQPKHMLRMRRVSQGEDTESAVWSERMWRNKGVAGAGGWQSVGTTAWNAKVKELRLSKKPVGAARRLRKSTLGAV